MKNLIIICGATVLGSLTFVSCGSSIESDAKKLAELLCKSQKLSEKVIKGDVSSSSESMALAADAALLSTEIEGKYATEEENQKFQEAYLKELGKCK